MTNLITDAVRRLWPYLLIAVVALACGVYWGHSHATRKLTPQINQLTLTLEQERGARVAEKLASLQIAAQYIQAAATDADRLAVTLAEERTAHQKTIEQLRGKTYDAAKPIASSAGADGQCLFGPEFIRVWNAAYYLPANSNAGEATTPDSVNATPGASQAADR